VIVRWRGAYGADEWFAGGSLDLTAGGSVRVSNIDYAVKSELR
jgi:hypothetical protein